jgi:hypothetical protein
MTASVYQRRLRSAPAASRASARIVPANSSPAVEPPPVRDLVAGPCRGPRRRTRPAGPLRSAPFDRRDRPSSRPAPGERAGRGVDDQQHAARSARIGAGPGRRARPAPACPARPRGPSPASGAVSARGRRSPGPARGRVGARSCRPVLAGATDGRGVGSRRAGQLRVRGVLVVRGRPAAPPRTDRETVGVRRGGRSLVPVSTAQRFHGLRRRHQPTRGHATPTLDPVARASAGRRVGATPDPRPAARPPVDRGPTESSTGTSGVHPPRRRTWPRSGTWESQGRRAQGRRRPSPEAPPRSRQNPRHLRRQRRSVERVPLIHRAGGDASRRRRDTWAASALTGRSAHRHPSPWSSSGHGLNLSY